MLGHTLLYYKIAAVLKAIFCIHGMFVQMYLYAVISLHKCEQNVLQIIGQVLCTESAG